MDLNLYRFTFDDTEFPKSIGDRITQTVAYLRNKGAAEAEHLLAVLLGYAKESTKAKQQFTAVMTGDTDIQKLKKLAMEVNYNEAVSEVSRKAIVDLHGAAQVSPLALRSPKALKSLHDALREITRFTVCTDDGTSEYKWKAYFFDEDNYVPREQDAITHPEKYIVVCETASKKTVEFTLKQLESLHAEGKLKLFVETPLVII